MKPRSWWSLVTKKLDITFHSFFFNNFFLCIAHSRAVNVSAGSIRSPRSLLFGVCLLCAGRFHLHSTFKQAKSKVIRLVNFPPLHVFSVSQAAVIMFLLLSSTTVFTVTAFLNMLTAVTTYRPPTPLDKIF